MSGKELKEILISAGVNLSKLASSLGYSNDQRLHSALKAKDVKSGLIEDIARSINKSVDFFYGRNTSTLVDKGFDFHECEMDDQLQNVSPIKERILLFADTLGISKRAFYAKIGVSRGTLESKTGITEEVLAKFIAAYPEISLEWLILGNGDMLKDSGAGRSFEPPTVQCKHPMNDVHDNQTVFIGNWDGLKDVIKDVFASEHRK